jgi:prolycopene isomerase
LSLPEHGTLTLFIPAFINQYDYWKTERDENGNYIRGEEYKALKKEVADIILDRIEEKLIPGLREHILYLDIATPITHQRYTGNKGGSMMGQRPGKENSQGRVASYFTQYKNLFQSGHWADLGGGIPIAVKSSLNTSFLVLKQENKPVFQLLAKYMRGKLKPEEVVDSELLRPYDNDWKLKPTPAQKIMARKQSKPVDS